MGGLLYFVAWDPVHGFALWKSNGTEAGTQVAASQMPGGFTSAPIHLTVMNGALYFTALQDGDTYYSSLWRMDGTGGPPRRIAGHVTRAYHDRPALTVAGHTLYFLMVDFDAPELWKYDSLTDEASRVTSVPFDGFPSLVAVGDGVCFTGRTAQHGLELWCSDGTEGGTRLVKDLLPGTSSGVSVFPLFGLEEGLVFFRATDGVHGWEPWVSDGTPAGTRMVGDLAPGPSTSTPEKFMRSGNAVYFRANDGIHGIELWRVSL
jgi:ELWxxDGT repeat protein